MDEIGTDDVIIGFDDESTHRTDLNRCRIWSTGKPVKTNSTEVVSVNMMGFYPINGNPVCLFPKKGNSETFCRFLDAVRSANGARTIVMVLDNCRIHKTEEVLESAASNDIRLCFMPPYSPQLNPIEYIWKTVKRELSKYGILSREQVISVVEESFMKESESCSYFQFWINLFKEVLPKKLCY